ncbi:3-hydroxyacyl-CoA dehydrogenase family protein [Lentzea nigeriaca]|uniref:3-hydroxyacyl-CoA dehydrogenase family protein n=1 Tax=Lentzea nigeriaca TaxID=1128665 RepID=UPI0019564D03|nr:3-hydroxyacyl-CoA dehydrogenase family protein [Lentzea nigeriaca]MBM7856650.1 3-hydroxybutyryl-CoA dehydrogenase [Lentzea nigeriaca]
MPLVIGVVGLGGLGEGLAKVLLAGGAEVIGVDSDLDVLARVHHRLSGPQLSLATELADLKRADLVIEALPEDFLTKETVLRQLVEQCAPGTVFLTTTSTLPVAKLAIASGAPDRVVGLRYSIPPPYGQHAGLITTAMAAPEAIHLARRAVRLAGTEIVSLAGRPAEAATALLYACMNRTIALADAGYATVEDLDTAMKLGCGLRFGPLHLLDLIGLDTVRATLTTLHEITGSDSYLPSPLLDRMVERGHLGRKTGKGFHRYDDRGEIVPPPQAPAGNGEPREIRKAGVVGAGLMGRGIAEVLVVAGIPTTLIARTADKAEQAADRIRSSLTRLVHKGRMSEQDRQDVLARLTVATGYDTLADADIVIEAVAEDMDVKRPVLQGVDAVLKPGAIIATTTSSLSVTDCATATSRPADVIGLHFFNPAPVMKLVEIVRTEHTADDVHATAHALVKWLRKTAVDCADRVGFIVNHVLFPYLNDAIRMLDRTDVTVEEIDTAIVTAFHHPMGPFTLLDTIGLDVSLAILETLCAASETSEPAPAEELRRLVAAGHLGTKTGSGFRLANKGK